MSFTSTAFVRRRMAFFMPHTYTRQSRVALPDNAGTPTVDESEDDWAEQAYDPNLPAPVGGQQCRWIPFQNRGGGDARERRDAARPDESGGSQVMIMPTMLVPYTDPIKPGDLVLNVMGVEPETRQPRLLFAGPAKVISVQDSPAGDAGGIVSRRVHIRTAQETV